MKKILGIGAVCLLGLCCLTSCTTSRERAVNQDLAERVADCIVDDYNEGRTVCNGVKVYVYNGNTNIAIYNSAKVIQYREYFTVTENNITYTYSNSIFGYSTN